MYSIYIHWSGTGFLTNVCILSNVSGRLYIDELCEDNLYQGCGDTNGLICYLLLEVVKDASITVIVSARLLMVRGTPCLRIVVSDMTFKRR